MKKTAILFMALTLSMGVFAYSNLDLSYRLSGTAGGMLKDGRVDKWLQGPMAGGTFAVEFHPTGGLHSLQQWNNASIGVGTTYMNLGNNEKLGNMVALYGYLNLPFFSSKHFRIGIRPTVGIAFLDKRYINTLPEGKEPYSRNDGGFNESNQNIGSVLNAYLAGELFMDFPIKDGWEIICSGGFYHVSNGSVMAPNGGYNIFGGELGLRYHPENQTGRFRPRSDVPHRLYDGVDKPWAVEISMTGSARQVYYGDNYGGMKFFGVASIKAAAYWVPLSIFRLGAGLDAFYDGYYACVNDQFASQNPGAVTTSFGKTYLKESNIANCFRLGFSIQPELIIGKLTAGFHVGFYLYDPVKNLEPFAEAKAADEAGTPLNRGLFYAYDYMQASNKQDGWCYMQLVLKYHVLDHLFVQVSMKSHGVRAEFVDAGLGVAF